MLDSRLTRRRFLALAACGASASLLGACAQPTTPSPTAAPAKPADAPKAAAPGATEAAKPAAQPAASPAPAAAAAKPSGPKDQLKLPMVASYELNLPSLIAYANGYFGDENIEVTDFIVGSGGTLRTGLIAKEYDYSLLAFVHIPLARLAGSPFKMILSHYDREIFSLVVRSQLKDEVKTVADLKGKTVGFSTPGSGSWALGSVFLKKSGLDPDRDVQYVSLGGDPAVIYTALQGGKVDAFPAWEPTLSRAIKEGVVYPLIPVWMAEEHRKWVGSDKALALGLATREDVIQGKPDLTRRMVSAHKKGLDFIGANNAAAITDVVLNNAKTKEQFEGLDRTLVVDMLEKLKPGFGDGCLSRSGFKAEMDLSVEFQLAKAPITFEEFADTTFAPACA